MASLDDLTDEQLQDLLATHHTIRAAASTIGMSESTFRDALKRRGVIQTTASARSAGPGLTRALLDEALRPPNNCKVKAFRDKLPGPEQKLLDEALGYRPSDLTAARLRQALQRGYPNLADHEIPGVDAINSHRNGTKPCRCK